MIRKTLLKRQIAMALLLAASIEAIADSPSPSPVSEQGAGRFARAPLEGPEAWLEFMGGNVRTDGLRLDLEAIRAAGFSGVHFFHIGDRSGDSQKATCVWPGCEDSQTPCLSAGWDDLMRVLGEECARLNLGLTVQNCPGWSQSGGPWVDLDHCQRDLAMARVDLSAGEKLRLPAIPAVYRDRDSDWRDICVLAFPTPTGDAVDDVLKPDAVEKPDADTRIFRFNRPVTVRTLAAPPMDSLNPAFSYHSPWLRVSLEVQAEDGRWQSVLDAPLPTSNWRDYVLPCSQACREATGCVWRYRLQHDYPLKTWIDPVLHSGARHTDWEGKTARTLRSRLREAAPVQNAACWVKGDSVVDITGQADWMPPQGRWTVLRVGHINPKYVNAPAPPSATGWECDKLDPAGIEAHFEGYVARLATGVLKGRMRGMLVDSWECFGQTWTPRMEQYFFAANGYALRRLMPALFGWVIDSPDRTEKFLTDWRCTIGDLIAKNYFGRMAELAHAAGLEVFYQTAFGDIVPGDLLEYWKYADAPMCEFWYPHRPMCEGHVGCYAFKSIRPCASAAHVYGKRRVVAEAFTGSGIHWDEDFRRLQDIANRHFARGVTHLAFQSYTHAPTTNAVPPGGCMGGWNGTPFTRLQTWWQAMPEFTGYLTRCERFLETGLPVLDVLWYLGDDADHKPDEVYPFPEGFRADYVNHDVLTNRLTVARNGDFTIPEGTRWKLLWIPEGTYLLPASERALTRLSAAGGRIVRGDRAALVRALAAWQPDVATDPTLGDEPSEDFMWFHRHVDGFERYFVAAGTNGYRGRVTFRAKGPVSVYDPVSMSRKPWRNGDWLEIPPSRSVFVEFGVVAPTAESRKASASRRLTLGPWRLSFAPGWDAPPSVTLDQLVSWSEIPSFSRAARAYPGTVVYETEFTLAAPCARLTLDLGMVESLAKVYVNGVAVRTLWCLPFACDLARHARVGTNKLRLEVTNTWRNRVIYDLGQPLEARKTWILYQKRYNPSADDPYVPAGVLGPVALVAEDYL